MKKNILLTALLSSVLAFSQVGIDTTNPQAKFHVDGAKDNPVTGVPTTTQQLNDFAVTSDGLVGIGMTAPTAPLTFPRATGRKISLFNTLVSPPNDHQYTGFGMELGYLINQLTQTNGNFLWRAGTSSTTSDNLMTLTGTGRLGINTQNPNAKLHIVAAANENGFQLQDGTEKDKRVLTSDADGVGTWQSLNMLDTNFVHMDGTQAFNSAPSAASGTPTVFDPTTTPTGGGGSLGITFPTNSRVHLPQGRYLVFVRTDLAGSEFAAFGAWRESTGGRVYYSYYGDFLANPSFIVDFRNSPTGDSLYFTELGLTNNPSPTYYNANYANNTWQINLTISKID
ncbi:hypothetical protein HNP24_000090 [Chryseobacterium sediminis]|uniref:Uncharacterized protein n=1 Tax=Chryseobacterium sediminis TaxID=1679494 RepID=A0ABR6PTW4_9FLAO|nr:hypothetical protein [Chryseobacterium sediminis]MBB6329140.1 hypothetical protein [Chryseobacterium sediminis]